MPDEREKNLASAGISPPIDIDVASLFSRLRDEVRRTAAPAIDGDRKPGGESLARAQAERVWPVTFDHPVVRRPGLKGAVLHPVKRTLRRLIRWYVEPLAVDQRAFNEAALKLVDELHERADAAERRAAALEERAGAAESWLERDRREREALELRLTRVERRGASAGGTVAAQPSAGAVPDYFAFETTMRASPGEIRERQRPYVDDFRDAAPVLDVGCGRGEFLALLREAGVPARGVDADADTVAFARGEGLDVDQADALAYLAGLEDGSLGGIFAAQVVEHLPPPALLRLLELAAAKLRPGGLLVAETINPLSPLSLRHYFADLTHSQPLVPETLALLARHAGFARVETRFLNEPPEAERLRPVELPADPGLERARAALQHNVSRLNEQLFGPLDYAILARTPS
jgi:SAM-dependent methyltransferase